jgi:hypothetical protein
VRRPFPTGFAKAKPREAVLAKARPSGTHVQGDSGRSSSTTQATPAGARHGRRQEVSEPIGLGRSSHRERSRWEAPSRGKLTSARPLARDILAGRASKGALPSAAQGHDRKVVVMRPAALVGDRWRGHAGFWWSVVVLADRIDCRSRQAACGPSRPRTKSLRTTMMGLALPRESVGEVKERRKPDRRWLNRETGGGFPPNQSSRESGSAWEHLSREGASDRESRPL